MNIYASLLNVQSKLKAPKNNLNKFGKFKYRKAEDILNAVKPLLLESGLCLILSDEVKDMGGNLFIEATATIFLGDVSVCCKSQAGIPLGKKGMDDSQVYGCASSYARKYALSGLFAIDNTDDSDSMPPQKNEEPKQKKLPVLTKDHRKYRDLVLAISAGKQTIETARKFFIISEDVKEEIMKGVKIP